MIRLRSLVLTYLRTADIKSAITDIVWCTRHPSNGTGERRRQPLGWRHPGPSRPPAAVFAVSRGTKAEGSKADQAFRSMNGTQELPGALALQGPDC